MNKKEIINYKVGAQNTLPELEQYVQNQLENGWQPYGQMIIINTPPNMGFYQSLVKYNKVN